MEIKEMAQVLKSKLTDEEMCELQRLLDEQPEEMWEAVSEIVATKHPELFTGPNDVNEKE